MLIGSLDAPLRRILKAGYLVPDLESMRTFPAVRLGVEPMAARAAVLANRAAGRQEALGMTGGLETAHDPLALARRLVGVFGTIVQPFMAAMLDARHDLLVGSFVTAKLIRDQHAWNVLAAFEEFAEELLGRRLIPAALDEDIQHVPVLVNRTPQIRRFPIDLQENFVKVPLVAGLGTMSP
jgi:hypothetical protein